MDESVHVWEDGLMGLAVIDRSEPDEEYPFRLNEYTISPVPLEDEPHPDEGGGD
jgi:hypothetical protein